MDFQFVRFADLALCAGVCGCVFDCFLCVCFFFVFSSFVCDCRSFCHCLSSFIRDSLRSSNLLLMSIVFLARCKGPAARHL